jgi:hypothetical protein
MVVLIGHRGFEEEEKRNSGSEEENSPLSYHL